MNMFKKCLKKIMYFYKEYKVKKITTFRKDIFLNDENKKYTQIINKKIIFSLNFHSKSFSHST